LKNSVDSLLFESRLACRSGCDTLISVCQRVDVDESCEGFEVRQKTKFLFKINVSYSKRHVHRQPSYTNRHKLQNNQKKNRLYLPFDTKPIESSE